MIIIHQDYEESFLSLGLSNFEKFWDLEATLFKYKKERAIYRVSLKGEQFFLKRYFSLPLFGKNDARNEWEAARVLAQKGFGVPRPAAFGEKRKGLKKCAFTLFQEVKGQRLEDLFKVRPREALEEILPILARFAGCFHRAGFSHQDFYLCHFFWDGEKLILIDLQRVRWASFPKYSWVIKDVAQLFYAAERVLGEAFPLFVDKFYRYYAAFIPWAETSTFKKKVLKKKQRIARHDAKLRARLSFKDNGRK